MKEKMSVMNRWLEEAAAEGGDAAREHLHAMARIIGGQVALIAKPEEMPSAISKTIEEVGKGITSGVLMHHGRVGVIDVKMFSVERGGR